MIEFARPSKRRFANVDENERIALRQTVLNMSICKLQKDQGRREPSLLRSVVISNTVKQIESEMDDELVNSFNGDSSSYYSYEHCDTYSEHYDSCTQEKSEEVSNKPNKFGTIGDHRKNKCSEKRESNIDQSLMPGFFLENNIVMKPYSMLDGMQFRCDFPDIDISLYDFDSCSLFSSNNVSQSGDVFYNSCAAEYEKLKPDAFFDEIEQIMQVLVGI